MWASYMTNQVLRNICLSLSVIIVLHCVSTFNKKLQSFNHKTKHLNIILLSYWDITGRYRATTDIYILCKYYTSDFM